MKMKACFFVVAALITGSRLFAQDTTFLDEVVLTPNKIAQKQSQTGKVVTVITREELERNQGRSLSQLLTEKAGITVAGAYNTPGSVQTLFMRGASGGRTLVLLDGIPLNDPSFINNEFDLNLVPIQDIERIEICRGAMSTLYGSDAIAGTVNIITIKKDVQRPFNIKALLGAGNRFTQRSNLQVYGKTGGLQWSARYARLSTTGFSSAHDSTGRAGFDNDGYDGYHLHAQLQYEFTPGFSARAYLQRSRYDADLDAGVFADDRDFTLDNFGLQGGIVLRMEKEKLTLQGAYQVSDFDRHFLNDSLHSPGFTRFERNEYEGKSRYAEFYGNYKVNEWMSFLLGGDYRRWEMEQYYFSLSGWGPYSSYFSDSALKQTSFFSSLFIRLLDERLNLEGGVRFNEHSRYGNNSTFTFNPSFRLSERWRIFGSAASGFKAPSIYQVFDDFSGNRDLKPERSTTYELGVQYAHPKISSRLLYFTRETRDGIDYDNINFHFFNYTRQRARGVELELNVRPHVKTFIDLNYSFLDGKETTQSRKNFSEYTYDYLLRRPRHSLNLGLGYRFCDPFFARLSLRTASERYDVGGFMKDDVRIEGYYLLNAYGEYRLNPHIRFFADLQNLTDKRFFDIRGYNAMPFTVSGGLVLGW